MAEERLRGGGGGSRNSIARRSSSHPVDAGGPPRQGFGVDAAVAGATANVKGFCSDVASLLQAFRPIFAPLSPPGNYEHVSTVVLFPVCAVLPGDYGVSIGGGIVGAGVAPRWVP